MWPPSRPAVRNSLGQRRECSRAGMKDWGGFGKWKKSWRGHWSCWCEGVESIYDGEETMSFTARHDVKKAAFFRAPDWFRLPDWLTSRAPDFGQQATRIRTVERHIILPVKGAIMLLLVVYLFFSNWFDEVYTYREAVLLTVRLFFLIYVVINLAGMIILAGMDELPFKLIRELVLAEVVVDILFWAAMAVVTGGFDSMLYWLFLGLIIRTAVSVPVASTQIVLNLLACACFFGAGLVEVAITNAEPEFFEESNEPYILRMAVLLLMTFCCYGLQVLFDKQRRVNEEAIEFAQRQQQLQSAGRLAAEIAHQLKNPLGIINNAAFTLQRTVKEGKTITQQIQIIREEVERSDRIITELMGYARLVEGRVEKQAILRVFPSAVKYEVKLHRDYSPALPPLLMQRMHLSEAFVNLLQNAREAMSGRGNIYVCARMGENYSVTISIADDGPGIAPEKVDKIFEPYFTTK